MSVHVQYQQLCNCVMWESSNDKASMANSIVRDCSQAFEYTCMDKFVTLCISLVWLLTEYTDWPSLDPISKGVSLYVNFGKHVTNQTWSQFHFVNSNSTQFHLVNSTSNLLIPIPKLFQLFFCIIFLPWVDTLSTYLEYILRVVYIPSRIVMEDIFLN